MRMSVFLAFVIVTAVARSSSLDEFRPNENVFEPSNENCTRNLLEMILWQNSFQSIRLLEAERTSKTTLETISGILLEMKDLISSTQKYAENRNKRCDDPFMQVGYHCLLLAPNELITWAAARQYCAAKGSDMVTFKDANTYVELLDFINTINSISAVKSIWVGGSDEESEGVWKWINGDLMPSGSPFWGSTNGYRAEPGGARAENCAILYQPDKHYLHDISCATKAAPFCEKK